MKSKILKKYNELSSWQIILCKGIIVTTLFIICFSSSLFILTEINKNKKSYDIYKYKYVYKVKSGDTLSDIACFYYPELGYWERIDFLAHINGMREIRQIHPGQSLIIQLTEYPSNKGFLNIEK